MGADLVLNEDWDKNTEQPYFICIHCGTLVAEKYSYEHISSIHPYLIEQRQQEYHEYNWPSKREVELNINDSMS
jgi:hypothetical protein